MEKLFSFVFNNLLASFGAFCFDEHLDRGLEPLADPDTGCQRRPETLRERVPPSPPPGGTAVNHQVAVR
jgi:hypothetical protein